MSAQHRIEVSRQVGRRSYGSGRIALRTDSRGVETFYGVWRSNGRQVKRRLGVKRSSGGRDGLTTAQAEAELRRMMSETVPAVARGDRLTLSEVGGRYQAHLKAQLDVWHQTTRWTTDDALVFAEPAGGGVLRRGALMRRYRRALKAARLEQTHRFHDLRHTFGTAMAAAGVPMRTLQEVWTSSERAHYVSAHGYLCRTRRKRSPRLISDSRFAPCRSKSDAYRATLASTRQGQQGSTWLVDRSRGP